MIRSEGNLRNGVMGRGAIVMASSVLLALALAFASGAGDAGGSDSDADGVQDASDNSCLSTRQ